MGFGCRFLRLPGLLSTGGQRTAAVLQRLSIIRDEIEMRDGNRFAWPKAHEFVHIRSSTDTSEPERVPSAANNKTKDKKKRAWWRRFCKDLIKDRFRNTNSRTNGLSGGMPVSMCVCVCRQLLSWNEKINMRVKCDRNPRIRTTKKVDTRFFVVLSTSFISWSLAKTQMTTIGSYERDFRGMDTVDRMKNLFLVVSSQESSLLALVSTADVTCLCEYHQLNRST